MSMTTASKYGFKKSFPFNLGVLLGFLVVMGLSAAFSTLLYRLIPHAEPVMLWLGAVYILWLAWSVWKDAPHGSKQGLAQTASVLSGMVLQFVNVKVILYGITAMSTFILPHYRGFFPVAFFVILLSVTGFAGTCCWALFGSVFKKFFNRHRKASNAAMALLLVYCAVTMVA